MLGYVVPLQLPEPEGRKSLNVKYDPEASDSGLIIISTDAQERHSEDIGSACGAPRTP